VATVCLARNPPNRAQIHQPLEDGRCSLRRPAQRQGLGACCQLGGRHKSSSNPMLIARAPLNGRPFEHEFERGPHTDELHAAHGAAKSGVNAEQHFGQAPATTQPRRRRPGTCMRAQFRPPLRRNRARGDGRKGKILEWLHDRLSGAHQFVAFRRRANPQEFLDVGPAMKPLRLPIAPPCRSGATPQLPELLRQLAHHSTDSNWSTHRHVTGQPSNAVGVDLQCQLPLMRLFDRR